MMRLALGVAALAAGTLFTAQATAAVALPQVFCSQATPDCTNCMWFPASGFTYGICRPPSP